jgi:hypothetical protein
MKKKKNQKWLLASLSSSSRHLDLILHNILLQPQHDEANRERVREGEGERKKEREREREREREMSAKKYGLSKYKRLMWPFRSKITHTHTHSNTHTQTHTLTRTHTHTLTNFAHFSNNLSKSKSDLA